MHYRAYNPTISANGQFIAFSYNNKWDGLNSPNPVLAGETVLAEDVYLYETATGKITRVSVGNGRVAGNSDSYHPSLSADGRYVVFSSAATNLVSGDTNNKVDVFRHDRLTGQTIRVSVTSSGAQIPEGARSGSISGDGNHVQFDSYGSTITSHSVGAGTRNTFVRDLAGTYQPMRAKVVKLAKKAKAKRSYTIKTAGIGAKESLTVRWKPVGKTKGKVIKRSLPVKANKVRMKAPVRLGKYRVTVTYAGVAQRAAGVRVR